MLDVLQGFVHELRVAGLPVSMTENLDAMRAVEHVPLDEPRHVQGRARRDAREAPRPRQGVRDGLRGLLLDVQPGRRRATGRAEGDGSEADFEQLRQAMEGAGAMGHVSNEELAQMLLDALMNMDREQLRCSPAPRLRGTRAWSRAGRSAVRTTSTARCGSSTPKASSAR